MSPGQVSKDDEVRNEILWAHERLEAALLTEFKAKAEVMDCRVKLARAIQSCCAPVAAVPGPSPAETK